MVGIAATKRTRLPIVTFIFDVGHGADFDCVRHAARQLDFVVPRNVSTHVLDPTEVEHVEPDDGVGTEARVAPVPGLDVCGEGNPGPVLTVSAKAQDEQISTTATASGMMFTQPTCPPSNMVPSLVTSPQGRLRIKLRTAFKLIVPLTPRAGESMEMRYSEAVPVQLNPLSAQTPSVKSCPMLTVAPFVYTVAVSPKSVPLGYDPIIWTQVAASDGE
uniref:Uncharacterized protein n=1 Tax=Mycena chlorophos TaxID=658473 RepID=A0ABQ0LTN2_MYCCL|nr:predicted protein [Mycena chlorophos]